MVKSNNTKFFFPSPIQILLISELLDMKKPATIYKLLSKWFDNKEFHNKYSLLKSHAKVLVKEGLLIEKKLNHGSKEKSVYKVNKKRIVVKKFKEPIRKGKKTSYIEIPLFGIRYGDNDEIGLLIPKNNSYDQYLISEKKINGLKKD